MYNNKLIFNTDISLASASVSAAPSTGTSEVSINSVASSCENLITLIPNLDIDTGVGLVLDMLPEAELSALDGCLAKMLDPTLDLDTEVGTVLNTLEKSELDMLNDCLSEIGESTLTTSELEKLSTSSHAKLTETQNSNVSSSALQPVDSSQAIKGKKRKPPQSSPCQEPKKGARECDFPLIKCNKFADTGIKLTEEQKKTYIDELDSILTGDIDENKSLLHKCAMIKGLLEGESFDSIKMKVFYITHRLHQRKSPPCTHELVIQMFEYYHYGGLALLRGFPTSNEQRTYPARMMQAAINMFLEGHSCRTIDKKLLSRTQNDEFGVNEVTPAPETIRRFLDRCGFAEAREKE